MLSQWAEVCGDYFKHCPIVVSPEPLFLEGYFELSPESR